MDQESCAARRVSELRLEIGRDGRHRSYVETPWKIFGPVYHPNDVGIKAWEKDPAYFLSNTTAGILAGDNLSAEIEVDDNVTTQIITPAATKIFSMPHGSAAQNIHFHLKPGARLYYHGNQLIPYRNADYRQSTAYRLDDNAALIAMDFFAPGRIAGEEAFAFRKVRIRTRVYVEEQLLLDDRIFVDGGKAEDFMRPGVFAARDSLVMGTLIIVAGQSMKNKLNELSIGEQVQYTMPEPNLLVGRALTKSAQEAECYFKKVIRAIFL